MRLYDIAQVIRSKNAGPFTLTLDLVFDNYEDFDRVLEAEKFNAANIAEIYNVKTENVKIHPFRKVRAIKISLPRIVSSGAPGDNDVYGSQQHLPLAQMDI